MADLNNNGIDDALESTTGFGSPALQGLQSQYGIPPVQGGSFQGGPNFPGQDLAWVGNKKVPTNKAVATFLSDTSEGKKLRTDLRNKLTNLGYSDMDNQKLAQIYKTLVDQSAKQLEANYFQSPDDLFGLFYTGEVGTGKAQAYNNLVRSVKRTSVQLGVGLTDKEIKDLASKARTEGWDAATIGEQIAAVGARTNKITGKEGMAAEVIDKLKENAYDYGVAYDEGWYQQAANSVLEGKEVVENFFGKIKDVAKGRYAAFADQIDAGLSPLKIASPYIQTMASLLELDPNSIGLNDPTITKALTSLDEKGMPKPTPLWQFEKDLLNDERINTTKFAERNIYAKGMEYLQRQKLV